MGWERAGIRDGSGQLAHGYWIFESPLYGFETRLVSMHGRFLLGE